MINCNLSEVCDRRVNRRRERGRRASGATGQRGCQPTTMSTSAKKPFSPDVSSPRPDEASPLFASRPSGSPEPSLPFISCVWCARTPHFPSKASDALLATPPPPSAFLLYLPPYLLVYRPPAYSYQLRASGGPPRSPLTSSDLDLSAPVR